MISVGIDRATTQENDTNGQSPHPERGQGLDRPLVAPARWTYRAAMGVRCTSPLPSRIAGMVSPFWSAPRYDEPPPAPAA